MKIPPRPFGVGQSAEASPFPPRSHAPRSHAPSRSQRRGSTIFITLIVAALVALTLGAYLTWSKTQSKLATRAQAWNAALPMVEAGLEEAMAHLNYDSSWGTNGWTLSGTNYVKQRTFGDGYYLVKLSTNYPPVIVSQGFVRAPLLTNTYVSRSVAVTCFRRNPADYAILSRGQISFTGNSLVDSYDSSNPLYSTLGQYDPLKREDHGKVYSNSGAVGAISVGNGTVYGNVDTGPGGTATIGVNGSVGDAAWHAGNNLGFEAGSVTNDVIAAFPDNLAPFTNGGFGLPGTGLVGGLLYTYVFTGGNYQIGALTLASSQSAIVTAPTVIYCTGPFSQSGQAIFRIAVGASLKFYINGTIYSAGGGIVNDTQFAANCAIYGMTNCTNVTIAGTSAFIGTVNAPQASITISGNSGYFGSVLASNVTVSGGAPVHYDEALTTGKTLYIANSWNEL